MATTIVTVDNASETASSAVAFDVEVNPGALADVASPVKYYTSTDDSSTACRTSSSLYKSSTATGSRYSVPIVSSVKTVCVSVYAKYQKPPNREHPSPTVITP